MKQQSPTKCCGFFFPHFLFNMNNEKNGNVNVCLVSRPRTKARAVTLDLFGAMQKNGVELQEVMEVLEDAVTGFLIPLSRHLGFDRDEIIKVFGCGLLKTEFKI